MSWGKFESKKIEAVDMVGSLCVVGDQKGKLVIPCLGEILSPKAIEGLGYDWRCCSGRGIKRTSSKYDVAAGAEKICI